MAHQRPGYLPKGMLRWDELGYSFPTPVPSTLLSEPSLTDQNPWISFAAILLRAQQGDFTVLRGLVRCLRETDSWVLARASSTLLGDAGPETLLRAVADEFNAELFAEEVFVYQIELAHVFYHSGLLWTVPLILELHAKTADDRDGRIIPIFLSHMLEPQSAEIAYGIGATSELAYRRLVMDRYEALRGELGSDHVACLYGEAYAVKRVAQRLYEQLVSGRGNAISIARERHRFEAATGIPCDGFFADGRVNRLHAAAIMEEFFESGRVEDYEAGIRYFFGRRIPD